MNTFEEGIPSALHPEWSSHMPTDAEIRRRIEINGTPIADLELCMRPMGVVDGSICFSGFIGKYESLLEVLVRDNKTVREAGLTHRDIALELQWWVDVSEEKWKRLKRHGHVYYVKKIPYSGGEKAPGQFSPFADGTRTNIDVEVFRVTDENEGLIDQCGIDNVIAGKIRNFSGDKVRISGLLPELVGRYGFYEGEVTYRLDPDMILSFFPYLQKQERTRPESSTGAPIIGDKGDKVWEWLVREGIIGSK